MAISDAGNGPLAKVLDLDPDLITYRVKVWIWLSVTYGLGAKLVASPGWLVHPQDEAGMAHFLSQNHYVKNIVRSTIWEALLPEQSLKWIDTDNQRQTQWALLYLKRNQLIDLVMTESTQAVLSGGALIVGLIDWISLPLTTKDQVVCQMHATWNEHIKKDSLYFWFKVQDEFERCTLMWDILMKENPQSLLGRPRFDSLKVMIRYFDESYYSFEQIKLLIERVKKRRSQNLYRQNLKGKKQVNWVLSTQAIKNLDKLAVEYGFSRVEVLETLIHDEAIRKIYMNERKRKYEAFLPTSIEV